MTIPMITGKRSLLAISVMAAMTASAAHAATATLTDSGYSENFDSMGTTGTTPPTGWAMYTGPSGTSHSTWTTSIPGSGVAAMVATTGGLTVSNAPTSTNNNGFNAAASPTNTSDRVIATSPTGVDGSAIQLTLTNGTGAAISSLNVSYDIDRLTAAASTEELPGYELFYSVNGGSTWTNVAALNPTLATVPNTVGVTAESGVVDLGTSVAAGGSVELRWVDDNAVNPSPDQIIGLNNVDIAPVPLPAALPLLLSALGGLGLISRRKSVAA